MSGSIPNQRCSITVRRDQSLDTRSDLREDNALHQIAIATSQGAQTTEATDTVSVSVIEKRTMIIVDTNATTTVVVAKNVTGMITHAGGIGTIFIEIATVTGMMLTEVRIALLRNECEVRHSALLVLEVLQLVFSVSSLKLQLDFNPFLAVNSLGWDGRMEGWKDVRCVLDCIMLLPQPKA